MTSVCQKDAEDIVVVGMPPRRTPFLYDPIHPQIKLDWAFFGDTPTLTSLLNCGATSPVRRVWFVALFCVVCRHFLATAPVHPSNVNPPTTCTTTVLSAHMIALPGDHHRSRHHVCISGGADAHPFALNVRLIRCAIPGIPTRFAY